MNARNPDREPQHGWPAEAQVPPPPPLPVLRPIAQQAVPVAKRNWFTNGAWYPMVVLLTLGLGCSVPFTHAGRRLRRPGVRAMGVVYTLVSYFALMLTAQNNGVASGIGLGVLFGAMIVETSHLVVLSRQIGAKAAAAAALVPAPRMQHDRQQQEVDAAVAKALTARAKRAEARALLATDPMLARDLHIGRPDLHGDYDDGGLVDVNSAPAMAIAATCDMKLSDAQAIVAMREERGQFANVDEMLVLVDLPVSDWDWIRDRAITSSV